MTLKKREELQAEQVSCGSSLVASCKIMGLMYSPEIQPEPDFAKSRANAAEQAQRMADQELNLG
jgi:hypothetical protein